MINRISKPDELIELTKEELLIAVFCKECCDPLNSINTITKVEESLDKSKNLSEVLKPGNIFYRSTIISEKIGEEYYFRIDGIYENKDCFSSRDRYVIKVLEVIFEDNELISLNVSYLLLKSFLNDNYIIFFGDRFPTKIGDQITKFLESIK